MTDEDHEDFKNCTKWWICKNVYEKGEVKVKDHDLPSREYPGSAPKSVIWILV